MEDFKKVEIVRNTIKTLLQDLEESLGKNWMIRDIEIDRDLNKITDLRIFISHVEDLR